MHLQNFMKESGNSDGMLFIATDASLEERRELQSLLPNVVLPQEWSDHPGKQAIVEMWVASRAKHFIGTQNSRFTMSSQPSPRFSF